MPMLPYRINLTKHRKVWLVIKNEMCVFLNSEGVLCSYSAALLPRRSVRPSPTEQVPDNEESTASVKAARAAEAAALPLPVCQAPAGRISGAKARTSWPRCPAGPNHGVAPGNRWTELGALGHRVLHNKPSWRPCPWPLKAGPRGGSASTAPTGFHLLGGGWPKSCRARAPPAMATATPPTMLFRTRGIVDFADEPLPLWALFSSQNILQNFSRFFVTSNF